MAKTKLRKGLQKSWQAMMENEGITVFLEKMKAHGDIKALVEKAREELESGK